MNHNNPSADASCDEAQFNIVADCGCDDDYKLDGFFFGTDDASYRANISIINNCDDTLVIGQLECSEEDACKGMATILWSISNNQ